MEHATNIVDLALEERYAMDADAAMDRAVDAHYAPAWEPDDIDTGCDCGQCFECNGNPYLIGADMIRFHRLQGLRQRLEARAALVAHTNYPQYVRLQNRAWRLFDAQCLCI